MVYYKQSAKKSPAKPRLQKRWFLNAGATLPYLGKTNLSIGNEKALVKRSIQQYVERNQMQKVKVINGLSNASMTQQTLYTLNPLGNISIGTGETSRLASEIKVKSIKLQFLAHSAMNQDVFLRFIWLRHNKQATQGTNTFESGLGTGDIFYENNNVSPTGIPDPDRCTILSDTTYNLPASNVNAVPRDKHLTVDCPITNFNFKYQSATSNYSAVNKNLYLVVTATSYGGTTGTTDVCSLAYGSLVVTYHDML